MRVTGDNHHARRCDARAVFDARTDALSYCLRHTDRVDRDDRGTANDTININGPYGEFYLQETGAEIVFIAGATGIAPIRSILFQMVDEQSQRVAAFYYGANELGDLYLVDEMREFERKLPNFTYVPVLARAAPEDDWQGETGLVTEVVDRHVPDASSQEFYLCGSPAMIDAAIELLAKKGLTEERTFYDKFA